MNVYCSRNGFKGLPTLTPQALLPSTPTQHQEAPCSVNGYFYVTGCADRFQATGRGATPAEAAANLQGTIQATKAVLETPVAKSREQRLAALLACGLERAVQRGDLALCERLAKAAALVMSGSIEATDSPAIMAVRSQADSQQWYEVTGKVCTCPDSQKHLRADDHGYLCKHALSVAMTQKLA